MTKEEAIQMAESKWWIGLPEKQVAAFQLNEEKLCMDFSEFHRCVEVALGRSVWTHEFAQPKLLITELNGDAPAPTFTDILNQIPPEKRIIINAE